MRKRITEKAVLFIVLLCFFSCDRYPDPETELLRNYYFNFQNTQQQKYEAGETIEVAFNAINNMQPDEDSLKVIFEAAYGGGSISEATCYTKLGVVYTRWTLGKETCEQKLRAKTYDRAGKYLTSTDLIEYGLINDEWNKITNDYNGYIQDMAADTINGITLMINNNSIYRQGARYFDWIPVQSSSPRTINIDREGVFYVSTYDGSIIKSFDHGTSWQLCTKPYTDLNGNLNVSITSDNYLWVYTWNRKVRFSKDGGASWTDVGSGMENGLGDIFRMKDGSLLYHGIDCCSLYRSLDETQTWKKIAAPDNSMKVYVDEKDKITLLVNGTDIYNSIDYGTTFTKVRSVPAYGQWSDNVFNKWKNTYYVLIGAYGILKSHDLTNYEDYWYNADVRNLFIDHNGNLFATGGNSNYYKKNTASSGKSGK